MALVGTATQSLQSSWRVLHANWQQACTQWRDSVRQDFENRYWREYETRIPRVIGEMDTLGRAIDQARRSMP